MFALFIEVVFNVVSLIAFFDTQDVSGWWVLYSWCALIFWVTFVEFKGARLLPFPPVVASTVRYVALVVVMWIMFETSTLKAGSELSDFEVIYWIFGAMWIVTKVYDLYDMLTSKKLKFNLMTDFEKLKKGFFL